MIVDEAGRVGEAADASVCRFVERFAATAFGVSISDLTSPTRGTARAAFARQAAMYLARIHLGLSFSELGRAFGRDRTTVAHACARIEDRRDDPVIDGILDRLEGALGLWQERTLFGRGA